jgi:hypothetical protein
VIGKLLNLLTPAGAKRFRAAWQMLGKMHQYRSIAGATYDKDGLVVFHDSDFLHDPVFAEAYRRGKATGSWGDWDIEWRAYIACWAAAKGSSLPGDFVECGVNRGGLSLTVMHYIHFAEMTDRKFYLLDTYCGFPPELRDKAAHWNRDNYSECYDDVVRTFAPFPGAVIVRGKVPDTLEQVQTEQICYLSIDMNCAEPEIAAARYFWPKMSTGAVMLLDDYGFGEAYYPQKLAFNQFAKEHGTSVLLLPTGQGLIFKP